MNAPSIDIKDFLVTALIGTFGTDLWIGNMPSSPDASVLVSDASGFKPESRYTWDRPGIKILVRAAEGGYENAYNKAGAVKTALHGQVNVVVNSTVYKCIVAAHEPMYLGEDKENRPLFSINFEAQRTPQ